MGRLEHIPFLMQIVRSGGDEGEIICGIPRDHAQIIIDAIDKAYSTIFNQLENCELIFTSLFYQSGTGQS